MNKFLLTIAVLIATQVASAASVEVTTSKGETKRCDADLVQVDSAANSGDVVTISSCGNNVVVPAETLEGLKVNSAGLILLMNQPNVQLQCQAADIRNTPPNYYRCEKLKITYRLKAPAAKVEATNSRGQSATCPIDLVIADSAANSEDVITLSACGGNNVAVPIPVLDGLKMDSADLMLLLSQQNVLLQCQAGDVRNAPANYFRCDKLQVTHRLKK